MIMKVKPCIGCGYCCTTATCVLGMLRYGADRPCPELQFDGRRFWCTLITGAVAPEKQRLSSELAIGAGCSSSLFNTQREACERGKLGEYLQAQRSSSPSFDLFWGHSPPTKSSSPLDGQRKK